MKKIITILLLSLAIGINTFGQNIDMKAKTVATNIKSEKHLSSSILLWVRTDKPRQEGMDRWKGPHSKIISANPGLWEYRQIHFAENNTGLWQPINGVETIIPTDRKIDGVADVTLKGYLSLLRGRKQNNLASADEVNLFKRTILYAAFPKNSRWYEVAQPNEKIAASSMVFFRKKEGVRDEDFINFINDELTPTLANTGMLKELRNKAYSPWKESQWNTPNVLHDNAKEVQFQASLMLGFTDKTAMEKFLKSEVISKMSDRISMFCSAVHAYEILETITFVKEGKQIK